MGYSPWGQREPGTTQRLKNNRAIRQQGPQSRLAEAAVRESLPGDELSGRSGLQKQALQSQLQTLQPEQAIPSLGRSYNSSRWKFCTYSTPFSTGVIRIKTIIYPQPIYFLSNTRAHTLQYTSKEGRRDGDEPDPALQPLTRQKAKTETRLDQRPRTVATSTPSSFLLLPCEELMLSDCGAGEDS